MEQLDNIEHCFAKLKESLVIGFRYDRDQGRFTLECDYPDVIANAQRAFASFSFLRVENYVREIGDRAATTRYEEHYESRDDSRTVVIHDIHVDAESNCIKSLRIWFGPNFGGLSCTFCGIVAVVRYANVEQIGGQFIYRDAASGQVFDFYAPFGEDALSLC